MATQTVQREVVTRAVEQYLANEGWAVAAETVGQVAERKAGFFGRVAHLFWRQTCGLSVSGFFLPLGPTFRHSNAVSPKEQALVDAYLLGL